MDFGSEATIFIGKNGAGKTNLIKSIKQLLSFIFSRRKDEPQFGFISSSDRNVISFKPLDARYGKDEGEDEFNYMIMVPRYRLRSYPQATFVSSQ